MRDLRVADVRLVRRVVEEHRPLAPRPVHPALEPGARQDGAGGVVREAEVDEVHVAVGERRREAVLRRAGQIDDAVVAPVVARRPGAPRHHVAVQVHGIDRVDDGHNTVGGEDLLDVRRVGLAAVAHEDLVGRDRDAALAEVVFGDELGEERVARLRAVPLEGLGARHLVHGAVERRDHRGRQRVGHVADPETDEPGARVRVLELPHPPRDLREKVARPELQVVVVDARHGARF